MDKGGNMESHSSSAAAFVEGGVQDGCDDSCSICLEDFCDADPSTVTTCKHEFHLQCILDWCQRSSQCPMCWQSIRLKDPICQELLEAVEQERKLRSKRSLSATYFHPGLNDFELQHLSLGSNDTDLEQHILHLAAAAAMGRTQHFARRERQQGRAGIRGRPQYVVFSTNSSSASPTSSESGQNEMTPAPVATESSFPPNALLDESSSQTPLTNPVQPSQVDFTPFGTHTAAANRTSLSSSRSSNARSTPDRAGPSDFQSFSDSLKSRFNAVSMRYRDSIVNSTRGWKERFFSRNASMSDLCSEVQREVNTGIATVSRMMEGLEARNSTSASDSSVSQSDGGQANQNNERVSDDPGATVQIGGTAPTCASSSGPN